MSEYIKKSKMSRIFFFIALTLTTFFKISSQKPSLKIMTYNIRLDVASDGENAWPNRHDNLSAQILFHGADIIGIQEALPNQVTDLAKALEEFKYIGEGRDGEGRGEACNIFYRSERFILKETKTFWLSESPDKSSKGWDASYPRICTYALFKDKATKKSFWVFNTHLDHMGEVARTKGIELILAKIKEVNKKELPVIFMGDFNSEPDTERIKSLKKRMFDSRALSENWPYGPKGTFNGFNHKEPVTKLIDYIFVSDEKKVEVKKYGVLCDMFDLKYASDHLPVLVEILLK